VVDATRALEDYILEVAAQRRRREVDDILSIVVAAEKAGGIQPAEVSGICLTLLLAGWETSSVLATNAMWLLARHPEQRRLLADEPERIPAAVEEMLRFESPAQQHSRVVVRETHIHGETISTGDRVVLLWAAANRDEERWHDSERFDVTREQKRNLAFGEGIHHCLGAPLARLEGRILLERVLARSPDFDVHEMVRLKSIVIRGISRLPITFA
jgi:cytochrome P450